LSPGGVITQWLPVFELSDAEVRAMIAAFVAELPHTALLYGYKEHLILIGSQSPLAIDVARARLAAAEPALARNLQRSGIGDLDDVLGSVVKTDAELRREVAGVAPVTDDLPSIQYPHENVREDTSYTTRLSITPAHAATLLAPSTDAATRAAVAGASRATAAAVAALPLFRIDVMESAELALGRALQPALHARPMNGGLWAMLGLDSDHVRAAEAARAAGASPHSEAAWTLARRDFHAGRYAEALDRLAALKPEREALALHALLRAGCLRALGRADESAAAFDQAAEASRDQRFKTMVQALATYAAAPVAASEGPWNP
jgi:hypothetical protein